MDSNLRKLSNTKSSSSREADASDTDAADMFARNKAACGGAAWNDIRSLQERGTMSVGGLHGAYYALRDLASGRSATRHRLGSMDGAGAFDGDLAWQRGPGGEVAVLDAPEAKRRARSQAWIDRRAYWSAEPDGARSGDIETKQHDGVAYSLIEVTPANGDPLTLWFASDSMLLERIVRRRGGGVATTVLDDWREVGALRLPFRSITEFADANGHVDARTRVTIVLDDITPNVPVDDADFAIPVTTGAARIEDASGTTTVSFDLVNNHIYVDATIDGQPVRLMVDTGGVNLLTPDAARRLGLAGEGKLAASGPGEGRVDTALARALSVRVGAAVLDNPVFYIIDLGELPRVEGVAFDGLIGYEMFRRFCIEIDYARTSLTLFEPARFVPRDGATELTFDFDRLTPIVTGDLDGIPVRLTVDTGSRASLTMAAPFVHANELVQKYAAAPEAVHGWGVGGPARMRAVRFGRLQLGELAIDGIAGDLFTGNGGAFTNPDHAGNLGGGVLRRFTVAFDYAARRLHLSPNERFGQVDAFDRSGLWLLVDAGALRVADVAAGSAAQLADIQVGDRIVAIDGAAVSTAHIAEWRRRLRECVPRTRIAMRIDRNGVSVDAELVLSDRIVDVWPGAAARAALPMSP